MKFPSLFKEPTGWQVGCKHEHQSYGTNWVNGQWVQQGECVLCGATMWTIPVPPDTRPAERRDAYRALRAAYHARAWK